MLKLMYITNRPQIALIAEKYGVDRIFVDLEYIGKNLRQVGMDTVQNRHTPEDVRKLREVLTKAQIMVRVNPVHEKTAEYESSETEINSVIAAGADIIMLPYFKTADEVREFISLVGGRAKTLLLIETKEAYENIDEILSVNGIDEVFIGLNDMSLSFKMDFMFELLSDGQVEYLCKKFKEKGLPFGFGGIASLDKGMLPGMYVIKEHYRLCSTCAILSRSFCNTQKITDLCEIDRVFSGLAEIRAFEKKCEDRKFLEGNEKEVAKRVKMVCDSIKEKKG